MRRARVRQDHQITRREGSMHACVACGSGPCSMPAAIASFVDTTCAVQRSARCDSPLRLCCPLLPVRSAPAKSHTRCLLHLTKPTLHSACRSGVGGAAWHACMGDPWVHAWVDPLTSTQPLSRSAMTPVCKYISTGLYTGSLGLQLAKSHGNCMGSVAWAARSFH